MTCLAALHPVDAPDRIAVDTYAQGWARLAGIALRAAVESVRELVAESQASRFRGRGRGIGAPNVPTRQAALTIAVVERTRDHPRGRAGRAGARIGGTTQAVSRARVTRRAYPLPAPAPRR